MGRDRLLYIWLFIFVGGLSPVFAPETHDFTPLLNFCGETLNALQREARAKLPKKSGRYFKDEKALDPVERVPGYAVPEKSKIWRIRKLNRNLVYRVDPPNQPSFFLKKFINPDINHQEITVYEILHEVLDPKIENAFKVVTPHATSNPNIYKMDLVPGRTIDEVLKLRNLPKTIKSLVRSMYQNRFRQFHILAMRHPGFIRMEGYNQIDGVASAFFHFKSTSGNPVTIFLSLHQVQVNARTLEMTILDGI